MNKQLFAAAISLLIMPASLHAQKEVTVYTTAHNSDYRLMKTGTLPFSAKPQPAEDEFSVFVDPSRTFQTMIGIGGALTDASAETFYKLPKDRQKEFLTAYFSKDKGIGYTLARTNIQSCDFGSESYSYVKEGDRELKTFISAMIKSIAFHL